MIGKWFAKTWVRVLVAAVLLGLVVLVRVISGSAQELEQGRRFEATADRAAAIVHYRRAARWYAPLNPYSTEALRQLAALGRQAEKQGETEEALLAWRAVRGSIMATRSFYTPHPEQLSQANQRIAELMSELPPPPIDAAKSRDQVRREHLALLQAVQRPNLAWTLVLLLGFLAWVVGGFVFAAKALDENNRLVPPQAWRWGSVIAVGFGLFVLGLSLA